MFYFWHTALVILFLVFSFFMGYRLGKKNVNKTEEVKRKQLHETLDKILDNPELYQVKGEKGVMVRGIFEEVEGN
jgi:hypothetical protein